MVVYREWVMNSPELAFKRRLMEQVVWSSGLWQADANTGERLLCRHVERRARLFHIAWKNEVRRISNVIYAPYDRLNEYLIPLVGMDAENLSWMC